MVLGLIFGIIAAKFQWSEFANDWIVTVGVFMNLLKLIAVRSVCLASRRRGFAFRFQKTVRMGGKTIPGYTLSNDSSRCDYRTAGRQRYQPG